MRRLKRILLIYLPILAGVVVIASIAAAGILTMPSRHIVGQPPSGLHAREVSFSSDSGSMIKGWFAPGEQHAGGVLLLHGVHSDRRSMVSRARFLHQAGYAVLLIDFQAEGESTGDHITMGFLESRDAHAALAYLKQQIPNERVAAIGSSMGGAAALLGTEPLRTDALVLESVYPTIVDATSDRIGERIPLVGRFLSPLLTLQLGPRFGFSTNDLRPIDRIGRVASPVLVIAGTKDHHTTIAETERLFTHAAQPKELWEVEGAGHVDMHRFVGAEYEKRILKFLEMYLHAGP